MCKIDVLKYYGFVVGVVESDQRQGRRSPARTQNTVASDIVVVVASPSTEVVSNRELETVGENGAPVAERTFDPTVSPVLSASSNVINNYNNGTRTMDVEIQVARPTRVTNI